MCAIFGIGFQNGHLVKDVDSVKTFIKEVFLEAMSRGTHASGIAFTSTKHIVVVKNNVPARRFVESKSFIEEVESCINLDNTLSIIGHCRLKTKGTPEDRNNNHPIISRKTVGIHNGTIANDEALFEKYKGIGRKGKVDSEVIFSLIDHLQRVNRGNMEKAISDTAGLLLGTFACATVNSNNPYAIWLFRNRNPIDVLYYPRKGVVAFATSDSFIRRAAKHAGFGDGKNIGLGINHGMGIDLLHSSVKNFRLPCRSKAIKDYRQIAI